MYLSEDSDKRLRREIEKWRIAAGESYKYAAEADEEGDTERAASLRERAAWQTRKAELCERLVGRDVREMARIHLDSIEVEDALKVLDRFDANPAEDVLSDPGKGEHTVARLGFIREAACSWAFGNAVRSGAMDEIVRMVHVIETEGVNVNLAALARMTGVSRQTLHARLRAK
ncbi:hypothetical protein [Streptomyces flaveolus]|uniref:hypothetical protein n=1 Tax=Streptomyces flaveolus TaxID=67297 RepID=UPI0037020FDC